VISTGRGRFRSIGGPVNGVFVELGAAIGGFPGGTVNGVVTAIVEGGRLTRGGGGTACPPFISGIICG